MALNVQILSPAKVVAKTEANQVTVPGIDGILGILPGHAALVSELGVGCLEVAGGDKYFVAGGYLEVTEDKVTLLVDEVEKADNIDRELAEQALKRAQTALESAQGEGVMVASANVRKAEERLAVAAGRS